MNEIVKTEIIRLRTEGFKFQEIANVFGLSINTVKSICLRNNIEPSGKPDQPLSKYQFCRCCGKRIEKPDNRKRVFCSQKCKQKWWTENPDKANRKSQITIICKHCGKPFKAYKADDRMFCSRVCYAKYHSQHIVCRKGNNLSCNEEQN